MGDLYVSAAGGRNSKMGSYLGKGYTFKNAKKRFMPNDTVEGEQLVREIAPYVMRKINKKKIPLMISLFTAIWNNRKLTVTKKNIKINQVIQKTNYKFIFESINS